jgi:quercetin dioxygenase-like cupin family protein
MDTPHTNKQIRIFDTKIKSDELVWHRDKRSRFLTVLEGHGWKVQFDNQLPRDIIPGTTIHINKNSYHRLLKGSSDLVVRIVEL